MKTINNFARLSIIAGYFFITAISFAGDNLLNVSYDPTRELYKEYNAAFSSYWKKKTGNEVIVNTSFAGSAAQARSVIEGLEADVVTLALAHDINAISDKGLIVPGWQKILPHNSSPYTSTIVLLVRKNNPKAIKNWDDLTRDGIEIVTPNPKTSGGARWNFLAAWGYFLTKPNGNEQSALENVTKIFRHVSVLDKGARASTISFVNRNIGDVLITWESEAYLALKEYGSENFQIIVPSVSILAEPTVAVVDKVVDKHGTRELANAYLKYLYSPVGQDIIARNYYRPINEDVNKRYAGFFPKIKLFTIDQVFGGWEPAHKKFFDDGGVFDQIMKANSAQ